MFRALKRLACPEGAEEFSPGFNPGNHQIRRLALKGRESTIRLIAPFVSLNLSVFRAPQSSSKPLKGKAVFEPAVYWLQALLELAIMARSKIEDETTTTRTIGQ